MAAEDLDLETVADNLRYRLDLFRYLPRPASLTGEYAEAMETVWRCHRRLGIAQLLLLAEREPLRRALTAAAELRLELLAGTQGRQAHEELGRSCRLSEIAPLFDALAAGRVDLALRISQASQAPFNRRYEYEEDHFYAASLFALLRDDEPGLATLLARFLEATEGEEASRYLACKALQERDGAAFEAALERMTEEHEELYQQLAKGLIADPEGCATEQYVFVEGLGLKVLAAHRGMEVSVEGRFLPREAFVLDVLRGGSTGGR